MPIIFKLKKIIIIPTIYVKTLEYFSIVEPKNVAVAPNETNTIEKPTVKSKVSLKIKYLFFSPKPSSVVPLIKDMYPGISGKTHGDIKLNMPAKNDKKYKLIISLKFYLTHHCYQACEHSHSLQYNFH